MKTIEKNKSFWKGLGDYLLTLFKTRAVKALVKAIFRSSTKMAGFQVWIVTLVVEILWDYLGQPIAKLAIRKGLLVYDKARGLILVKKLRQAKKDKDETAYDSTVDDILG